MKLYTYWRSSCSYRVRIALELKGLAVEHVPVHLVRDGGEQNTDEYAAINPMRQVPALVTDDGDVLVQSMAIIEYLEEMHPSPPLLPEAPVQRARARAFAELVGAGIQPLQNLVVLSHVERELEASKVDWARHFIARGLAAAEAMAAAESSGPFLVGDRPTVADVFLVPQLYNARRFELDMSEYPTLVTIDAAVADLDAFARAHPDRQADAPGEA